MYTTEKKKIHLLLSLTLIRTIEYIKKKQIHFANSNNEILKQNLYQNQCITLKKKGKGPSCGRVGCTSDVTLQYL